MNTRHPIQPSSDTVVLSVSFSDSRNRFIAGLSEGCRVFRTDNCLPTYQPVLSETKGKASEHVIINDGGVGVASVLDDRYLAVTGGGKTPQGSLNVISFWDAALGRQLNSFDFHERVLGSRLSSGYALAILAERTVVFEHQELELGPQGLTPPASPTRTTPGDLVNTVKCPNKIKALYPTSLNTFALACLSKALLVLPAKAVGQVQLIPLPDGPKRVFRAHDSALRTIAISDDGSLAATASVTGTLVRVWRTASQEQVAEFRRGMDQAVIGSLAISPGNRWLACTSDKGTIHVFDMKPGTSAEANTAKSQQRRSQNYASHRLSAGQYDKESTSGMSGRSSPQSAYQGSAQEYYGLRPPPMSASPTGQQAAATALSAFKNSSFAPRVVKDTRSVASAPFYTGNDPPHWQGGSSHSWTMAPNGNKKRVKNPVTPLPNDPSGRPPKGIIGFAPKAATPGTTHGISGIANDDEGAVIYVIGGGSDPRWELFELLPAETGGWALVNRGYRKYLTRQFVD